MAKSNAERQKEWREKRNAVTNEGVTEAKTVTKLGESVTEGVTKVAKSNETVTGCVTKSKVVTGCQHPEIEPCVSRAGKHLTYTKAGPSLADRQVDVIEPKLVTCPCCGKEWLCRRPDIQGAHCLRCDRGTKISWREQEPYVRPQMELAEKVMAALGVK